MMDQFIMETVWQRMERTAENLRKNRMEAYLVKTKVEAVDLIEQLVPAGQSVACGGSTTLAEAGVMDLIKSGRYEFWDRHAPGADREEMQLRAFGCDTYFASTNALTENGELINVDGYGNRVAAMIYGPKSVIVLAGYNKIVPDIEAGFERLRLWASPANNKRLSIPNPCTKTGKCVDCKSENRICCSYVIHRQQRIQGRIKVILVAEQLGY